MQIFYCERCGLRIAQDDLNSGRAQLQGENSAVCATCLAQTVSAAEPVPAAPFVPPRSSAHIVASASAELRAHRASVGARGIARTAQAAKPAYSHFRTALLAAGGVLIVAIFAVALSGRSSTPDASSAVTPSPATAPAKPPAPVSSPGQASAKNVVPESVPAQAPAQQAAAGPAKQEGPVKAPAETMEDFREGYAARRWADLKAAKPGGDWDHAIRVREFARTYASTNAGREAAAMLKSSLGAESSPANSVAAYRRDFKPQQPATGWSYLWNAAGALGNAANYKPLIWNAGRNQYCGHATTYPCDKPVAYTGASADRVHPGTGIEQGQPFDRYLIAAYTLQPGQQGHFALSVLAKRLSGSHGSIEIQVFINDTLKGRINGTGEELAGPLGVLKPGDTVYVALGPNRNDGSDSTDFDFTLFKVD